MESRPLPLNFVVPFNADTSARSKLDYWVAIERSVPGRMHLIPIFDEHNTIVDFRCAVATSAVARLLNETSGEAVGLCLSDLLSTQEGGDDILLVYIAAATSSEPTRFASVSNLGDRIQHRLCAAPRFAIEAELQDMSAMAEARAAFDQLKSGLTRP